MKMRWHWTKNVCSFLIAWGVLSTCTVVYGLTQTAENVGCTAGKNNRIAELEVKLSSMKTTLQAVRDRIDHVKHERERLETMSNLVQTETGSLMTTRSPEARSKRDSSQYGCSNLRDRVQLANGTDTRGRLEVLVGQDWSPVSRSNFGRTEAGIVCTALGFDGNHAWALTHEIFGDGGENFLVDESCRDSVGLMCGNDNSHQIRLVNGSNPHEGRVEIEIMGRWGTVCHNNWNWKTAQIACRMLGYDTEFGALAVGGSYFGPGTGSTWLSTFNCQGNEPNLLACSTDSVVPVYCNLNTRVGVVCEDWIDYPVRLVNGSSPDEGRVEVEILGQWGTVTKYNWDLNDARVVCRMLGYTNSTPIAITDVEPFGQGNDSQPVWLTYMDCNGNEDHLLQCHSNYPAGYQQYHRYDAAVVCLTNYSSEVDIRLVGGSGSNEGRVEVRYGRIWGTVCDDNWDVFDARVVCRQLGKSSSNAQAMSNANFGPGTGPIFMDEVNCAGTETNLAHCSFPGVGIHDCSHGEDAGVICA